MSCKTHRRVFNRESNPRPFSVSGKCRELNFSWCPADCRVLMCGKMLNKQGLRMYFSLENELGQGSVSPTNFLNSPHPEKRTGAVFLNSDSEPPLSKIIFIRHWLRRRREKIAALFIPPEIFFAGRRNPPGHIVLSLYSSR